MFENIKNKRLSVKFEDEYMKFSEEIQDNINAHWKSLFKKNPGLNIWDGDIFCVYEINKDENGIEIKCKRSKYSHYLYQESLFRKGVDGLPKEYECRNISAGSLIETSDGYFVVCELDENTSFPGVLQVPGGNVDNEDIADGKIDILHTIIRETGEEIDIDLDKSESVEYYRINGFYNADGTQPGTQIFARVKLKLSKKELEKHFKEFYERLEPKKREIGKLHFLHKNNCLEELNKLNNPKRAYLEPLLENNREQDVEEQDVKGNYVEL